MFGIELKALLAISVPIVLWIAIHFILPHMRSRILLLSGGKVEVGANLAVFSSALESIAATLAIAGIAVLVAFLGARAWLETVDSGVEGINAVVAFRDHLDGVLATLGKVSVTVWLAALAALAMIWVITIRSNAKNRWSQAAVDALKAAIRRSLEDKSLDDLRAELGKKEETRIRQRIQDLERRNQNAINIGRALGVMQFGDSDQKFSVNDFERIRQQAMDARASQDSEENHKRTEEIIRNVEEAIDCIKSQIELELESLEGNQIKIKLRDAEDYMRMQFRALLFDAVIKKKLQLHMASDATAARPEPELIREWAETVATSEAAVAACATSGHWSVKLGMVVLFLSMFGIVATPLSKSLKREVEALQLSLLNQRNSAAVNEMLASLPPSDLQATTTQTKDCGTQNVAYDPSDPPCDSANDIQTVAYLRDLFKEALVNSILREMPDDATRARARRSAFILAAVDVRQDLLVASERPAAQRADTGATDATFKASGSPAHTFEESGAVRQQVEAVDALIDERIAQLRQNEGLWQSLRREAARPARSRDVVQALFRTAMGISWPGLGGMEVLVRTRSAQFAFAVARNGGVNGVDFDAVVKADPPLTRRERRLVTDFRAEFPESLENQVRRYETGHVDPGSINRVIMRDSEFAHRTVNDYDDLFPAKVDAGSAEALVNPAQLARSFTKVRFNPNVGGVVIGRLPDSVDPAVDVVNFSWTADADSRILIELTTRDQKSVKLGPFHPAIVHAALTYAADGRVVTTTLPLSQANQSNNDNSIFSVPPRRVVVHPALEDTAMACRSIQIDRFVDTFAFSDDSKSNSDFSKMSVMRKGVTMLGKLLSSFASIPNYQRDNLYLLAIIQKESEKLFSPIARTVRYCGIGPNCFPVQYYDSLDFGMPQLGKFLDCTATNESLSKCTYLLKSFSPRQGYSVDSGVREMSYAVDANFDFLTSQQGTENQPLWPLDFIVQAVPIFPETNNKPQTIAKLNESEPWIFPSFANDLRTAVAEGIRSHENAKKIFHEMRDFTILQRLFRTALNGSLGLEFPLSHLRTLQKQTHDAVKVIRHERWNVNNQSLVEGLTKFLLQELIKVANSSTLAAKCGASVAKVIEAESEKPWPKGTAVWDFTANMEQFCPNEPSLDSFRKLRDKLREYELIDAAIHLTQQPLSDEKELFVCPAL